MSATDTTSLAWERALPYVPRTLVDAVSARGADPEGWVEALDGTLLVADVSGFTPLSEALARLGIEGAERLTGIMNGYFERLLEIAAARGGDNLKFGGDALLLAFRGAGHADRAVAAALAMQASTREFSAIRVGGAHQRLAMSIGVHTARFWFATAGTPTRMQHLLLGGDAARLAATEGAAERGEVAVTAETRDALTDADVEDLGDRLVVRRSADPPHTPDPVMTVTPTLGGALLPYLPPRVADSVRADEIDLRPLGDHRRVAVLFVGVRGVNELADREGPQAAFAELRAYLRTLLELLDRHHGYLAGNDIDPRGTKFICLFGAPVAGEDDAASALRFTADLLEAWAARSSPLVHQVGVNLGSVFAGDAGSSRRRDYTIIGDHVNLAARLMGVAAPGEAVAAAWVEAGLGARILTPDDPVTVKGKAEPVPIGRLRPGATWRDEPVEAPGAPARIVGRNAELARMRALLDDRAAGRGPALHVVGEPGTGRSALVEAALRDRLDWGVLEGRCYAYTLVQAYSCWGSVLRGLLGVADRPGDDVPAAVREAVRRLVPSRVDDAGLLVEVLGLDAGEGDRWDGLDGQARRELTASLVVDVLAAAEHPLAVVLEDVQWADTSSLALLQDVARGVADLPIALVVTSRPMEEDPLPGAERLVLGPLTRDAITQLLEELVGLRSHTLVDTVWEKAGGNPLFAIELAQLLVDHVSGDGAVDTEELPDRVQGLLMSRIDQLPGPVGDALRCAAVLGAEFEESLLSEVAGTTDSTAALDDLRRRRLVRPVGTGRHVFVQNLLQDVAYDSLPFARRRELHRRAAAVIERRHAHDLEPHLADLARHHRHGGDPRRTIRYAVAAGDRARRAHANAEALTSYRHALVAVDALRDRRVGGLRSLVRERIADTLDVLGNHREAATLYETSLRGWRASNVVPDDLADLAADVDRAERPAVLCRKVAYAHARTESAFGAAVRWLDAAERALPRRGHAVLRGSLAIGRATILFRTGNYDASVDRAREGVRLSRRAAPRQRAEALEALARPLTELGRLQEAIDHRREALEVYEELGDLVGLMVTHNNIGSAEQRLGNLDTALAHYADSREAARRLRREPAVAIVENNLGEVLLLQGRFAEATDHLQACIDAFDGVGAVAGLALVNLARARRGLEDLDAAAEAMGRGLARLEEVGATGLLAEARIEQALLAHAAGAADEAVVVARAALAEADELGMALVAARAREVLDELSRPGS